MGLHGEHEHKRQHFWARLGRDFAVFSMRFRSVVCHAQHRAIGQMNH